MGVYISQVWCGGVVVGGVIWVRVRMSICDWEYVYHGMSWGGGGHGVGAGVCGESVCLRRTIWVIKREGLTRCDVRVYVRVMCCGMCD